MESVLSAALAGAGGNPRRRGDGPVFAPRVNPSNDDGSAGWRRARSPAIDRSPLRAERCSRSEHEFGMDVHYPFACPEVAFMYRIEVAPGEETVFRTIEELAIGIRNGVITPRARIYHNASQKWLPIGLHPHYKKALDLPAASASPAPVTATTPMPSSARPKSPAPSSPRRRCSTRPGRSLRRRWLAPLSPSTSLLRSPRSSRSRRRRRAPRRRFGRRCSRP